MATPVRFAHLSSQGTSFALGGAGSASELHTVVIGSGATNPNTSVGASVKIWGSNPSTADSLVATLSASTTQSAYYVDFAGAVLPGGIQVNLLGANADVTITYS